MCDYSHKTLGFLKKCDYSHKSFGFLINAGHSSAYSKSIKNYEKSYFLMKISCDYSHNLIAILKKKLGNNGGKCRFLENEP